MTNMMQAAALPHLLSHSSGAAISLELQETTPSVECEYKSMSMITPSEYEYECDHTQCN